ncbi:hypothetical protein ILP92_16010 [Maribius pontilimi]|uniref:Uncharacterized protein n=1 Tax=Palleronia pontilimi TaxID=1964209 RepID=A0A934MIH0_9RHOB|nr:hypothetical protein [Palleronia pontilimi]MBJ3764254.1 hypothetical protein [Palleronia pontilimi]
MVFETQKQILLKDWDHGKIAIRDLDASIFKIRGWSITVFGGVLAASVALKFPSVALLSILSSLLFWALDGQYKSFQQRFILRDVEICNYLNSKEFLRAQKSGEIDSIPISLPFYELPRRSEEDGFKLSKKFSVLLGWTHLEEKEVTDQIVAMKLQNVSTLYISLIALSFLAFLIIRFSVG